MYTGYVYGSVVCEVSGTGCDRLVRLISRHRRLSVHVGSLLCSGTQGARAPSRAVVSAYMSVTCFDIHVSMSENFSITYMCQCYMI